MEFYSGLTGRVEQRWDFSGRTWPQQRPFVFAALFREFLQTLAAGGDHLSQARDNLKTLRLTLAAYESALNSVEVQL